MLKPVSETLIEFGPKGPAFPKRYDFSGDVDLMDVGRFTQGIPFGDFEALRTNAPVYWHDEAGDGQGFWTVSRYADIVRVSQEWELFSNQIGSHQIAHPPAAERPERFWKAGMDNLINLDGKVHVELRRQHMPFFTPSYIARLRKLVSVKIGELLDRMEGRNGCDIVTEFSSQLPLFTLSTMLGIPESDRPKLVEWMEYVELGFVLMSKRLSPEDMIKYADFGTKFAAKMDEMLDYGAWAITSRRSDPKEDLFTAIANATVDGELLSPEYIDGSWLLIYNAGNDTTRNTISGSVQLFTDNPDQLKLMLADDGLATNAAHEALRLISPVIFMRRTATADTEIAGQKIAAGEKVVVWYPSGNRDEAVFDQPNRFDIRRPNASKHIAFGFGRHICLGQQIAIMQLEEVYKQLFQRFPDLRVSGDVDIAPNNFVYAVRHMPVSYTPNRVVA
ncbi:MAG: cytochrome P450 [Pigmentiphaga sp.]